MVENDQTRIEIIEQNGIKLLTEQLVTGSPLGQELAAGSIWKACAYDPTAVRDDLPGAIEPLVNLLRTGTPAVQLQAAGAIRSACINSTALKRDLTGCRRRDSLRAAGAIRSACINSTALKRELNRANGVSALVASRVDSRAQALVNLAGSTRARVQEQALTALANVCANFQENQDAARNAGAMTLLVELLHASGSSVSDEIESTGIRVVLD
ncbi:armadillo-type protein [Baffinella frigidus]|nr:armadillo-type protein [Cryptophyta sp. CCMP2293]